MPTTRPSDAPTIRDWIIGFALTVFVVIGIPAFVDTLVDLVLP